MLDVLLYLSTSINFTYTLVRPPDGKWGVGDANGNWNGMLGMIKRREVCQASLFISTMTLCACSFQVDFALGPFGIIYEREKEACDFTYPVVIDYWTAIVPIKFEKVRSLCNVVAVDQTVSTVRSRLSCRCISERYFMTESVWWAEILPVKAVSCDD